MTTHKIVSNFVEGMAFHTEINDNQVITDADFASGGNQTGPSPKRMMLASLSGCTGIDIVSILNKMKVSFSQFSIQIDARLTEEHPKIYDQVHIIYRIQVDPADEPKLIKAKELSEEKYCGVMAMFRAFATVSTEVVFL